MRLDVVFFFKQKTAYEMRISDWSSDVCSSDLRAWPRLVQDGGGFHHLHHEGGASAGQVIRSADAGEQAVDDADMRRLRRHIAAHPGQHGDEEIGRASGRARVCQ